MQFYEVLTGNYHNRDHTKLKMKKKLKTSVRYCFVPYIAWNLFESGLMGYK